MNKILNDATWAEVRKEVILTKVLYQGKWALRFPFLVLSSNLSWTGQGYSIISYNSVTNKALSVFKFFIAAIHFNFNMTVKYVSHQR